MLSKRRLYFCWHIDTQPQHKHSQNWLWFCWWFGIFIFIYIIFFVSCFFLFLANGNLNENNHDSEQQRKFHYITMFYFCLSPTKRSLPITQPTHFVLPSISTNKYLIQFHYAHHHHHHHDHVHIAINCWATKTNQNISFDGKRFSDTIVFSLQRLCFATLRMMPVPKEVCTHHPIHNHLISVFLSLFLLYI